VDALFKLFDSITEKIPLSILLYIRMLAIFAWILAASVAVYVSWNRGASSAPPSGQDTYLSEIKEKETIEKNLKNPPPLAVPSLNEWEKKTGSAELPDFHDVVPENKNEKTLPPYISEKQTPDDTGAFMPGGEPDSELRRKEKNPNQKDSGSSKTTGELLPL